ATFLAAAVAIALTLDLHGFAHHKLLMSFAMLAGAAAMKREGAVMAGVVGLVVVAPRLWAAVRGDRRRVGVALVGLIAAVAGLMWLIDLRDIGDNLRALAVHPEAVEPLVRHTFTWSSFSFAFCGLPLALITIWLRSPAAGRLSATILTTALLGVVISIFCLTPQCRFALNDQT